MSSFRVARHSERDLAFDGDLLADRTSHVDGASRWTEVRIYRTDTGRYVAETVGVSTMPGEHNRMTVRVLDTAAEVPDALRMTSGGRTYLTDLALDALDEAAAKDEALAAFVTERI